MSACAAEMRPITRRWAALSVAARGFPRLVTMGGAEARSNRVVTSLTLIHLRRLAISAHTGGYDYAPRGSS